MGLDQAIKRVSGASVVGGKYVYVRGLGERYSAVRLNGAALPSADPDRRAVNMDLFPASMLDQIVTTKSFTPDRPGDFTGGSIDIGTKSFPDRLTMSASTTLSYNTQATWNDHFLTYPGGGVGWLGSDDGTRELPALLAEGTAVPDISFAWSDPAVAAVLDRLPKPPPGRTRWSTRSMARSVGLSPSSVHQIWRRNDIKPHQIPTFKLSRDPHFKEIAGLGLTVWFN